jgi:hypothetical protein
MPLRVWIKFEKKLNRIHTLENRQMQEAKYYIHSIRGPLGKNRAKSCLKCKQNHSLFPCLYYSTTTIYFKFVYLCFHNTLIYLIDLYIFKELIYGLLVGPVVIDVELSRDDQLMPELTPEPY